MNTASIIIASAIGAAFAAALRHVIKYGPCADCAQGPRPALSEKEEHIGICKGCCRICPYSCPHKKAE